MSNKKIDAAFIDDIFGIPRDGSNIGDDDEGTVNEKTDITFDQKVTEIAKNSVPKTEEKSAEKAPIKKEIETVITKKEEVVIEAKAAIPSPKASSMFEDILEDAPKAKASGAALANLVNTAPAVMVTTVNVVTMPVKTVVTDDLSIKAQLQPSPKSAPLIVAGKVLKHKWAIDSPSPKYQRFYEAKRNALEETLLKGGELPFDQYYSELENANVDVTVGETFQAELVCKKMSECQQHRERIKQVQLRVNRQYFQWERHMDLFAGLLSRVEYERGKQDGVNYEHMYDMESYFGELKSLHKSIDNVMRTLDSAFECLSRQVTVTMPMKDIERYTTGQSKPLQQMLQNYDGLKTHANGGSSIGTSRPKEAVKTAESQPKSGWELVD